MAAFQLYNPTTGTGNVQSGGVKYAESIEFDHTGEYVLYDAYNVIGSSLDGATIDYWDMGLLHVWNNNANTFGTGQISKVFSALEQGVSVGNPTFSKNSPYIIAFDYMDKNQNFASFGLNLSTGALNMMFANTTTAFPNYSIDDNTLAFASYNNVPFAGYVALGADKISISGQGYQIANYATFPIFYGNGARQLGLKPAAAFSADVRAGGAPLTAQFVDLSENNPTSWSWTFQGGTPATSTLQHPKVTYNSYGTYPVKLIATNSYGSGEVVKQSYITVGSTGIETQETVTATVYPNPTSGKVSVSGTWGDAPVFRLFDSFGRLVLETQEATFDISSQPAGLYLLSIRNDKHSITTKIIKTGK
jgi:PKD repeat protein